MPENAPKNTGKPVRLDARLLEGSDDLVTVCIPDFFRDILLALANRPFWGQRVWGRALTESELTRLAYGVSQLCIECEPMDCCEQIEDILTRLEELENMNINVNCGCGCSQTSSGHCEPPPEESSPPTPTEPTYPTPPNDEPARAWRCNAAHYLTDKFGDQLIYTGLPPNTTEWATQFIALFAPYLLGSYVFVNSLLYMVFSALAGYVWNVMGSSQIVTALAQYREMFICAIVNAPDDVDARESFKGVIDIAFPFSTTLRWVSKALANVVPFELAFQEPGPAIPGYSTRTCNCGPSAEFPEPPESGASLFTFECPVSIAESAPSEFTVSHAVDPENCWLEYSAAWPGSGNSWIPGFDIEAETISGRTLIGLAVWMEYLSTSGGNDPADGKVQLRLPTGYTHVSMLQGDVFGWVDDDYAADFSGWPGIVNVVPTANISSALASEFYRRSGVGAPAGNASLRMQVRFIYREPAP